jgi:isopenicillin N synthase-like dioxygenase
MREEGSLILSLASAESATLAATLEAGRLFFQQQLEAKMTSALPEDCGYRAFGVEYSQTASHPDQIESFTATARTCVDRFKLCDGPARRLYDCMLDSIAVLEPLAENVAALLAKSIGNGAGESFPTGSLHRWSRLQINYSRPVSADGDIHDLHEDGNLVTIACATGPGLEIQQPDGSLQAIEAALPHVIVMPGEIAWLLSGGCVRPVWHRVRRVPSCSDRLALLFFADLEPEACQPWLHNAVNANVDIGERTRRSVTRFGLEGFRP